MNVLDEIINGVREDLAKRRKSLAQIQEEISNAPAVSQSNFNKETLSIIAEVKRSSPSRGAISEIRDPAELAKQYELNGASAVSVLTEARRFNGSLNDLDLVRGEINIPILRKDFMVDEYQFYEARAHGADLVLLIVASISKSQLNDYYDLTKELGMKALVEVHDLVELEAAMDIEPEIIGVNARNLKTLEVSNQTFVEILPRIPDSVIKVAESGIANSDDVKFARRNGADVLLVGEALVKNGGDIKKLIGTLQ